MLTNEDLKKDREIKGSVIADLYSKFKSEMEEIRKKREEILKKYRTKRS